MISLLIFLLVLSILIMIHEFGHFIVAKRVGVTVERFSLGFGPKLISWKKGDTEYMLCAIPLGGYIKMAGDNLDECAGKPNEYFSKSVGDRAKIIFAGPLLNYILAFLCFWLVFCVGFPTLTTKVGGLLDDFPAKQAGIKEGDRIIAIDGKEVSLWEDMQKAIQAKKGESISVVVLRDSRKIPMNIALKKETVDNLLGEKTRVGLIGIKPADDIITKRYNPGQAFVLASQRVFDLTMLTYKSIWRMITRQMSFKESVTGPLGIFYVTAKAAHAGFAAVLHVMAVLSLSLAVFNLLPIPILDGGHIFLLAVEKIKGRHLSRKIDAWINQIGLSLIILLAVFVFYNDLMKFGIFEKIGKWFK